MPDTGQLLFLYFRAYIRRSRVCFEDCFGLAKRHREHACIQGEEGQVPTIQKSSGEKCF